MHGTVKYNSKLSLLETEIAIKYVKDTFEKLLADRLNLTRVSAPLFVNPETGLNDNLNGVEEAVRFHIKDIDQTVEIVQSLAKWKRYALKRYNIKTGSGLYTDMNAIRKDEYVDNIHSVYVDQWDWEKVISEDLRNEKYLFNIVKEIYEVLKHTEKKINKKFKCFHNKLIKDIYYISTTELENIYPNLTPKEREYAICKEKRSVFIYQIGWPLSNAKPHDGRAADYDDWKLNGDILVFDDVLDIALELSSMGIRVNEESLKQQLKERKEEYKLNNPYCQQISKGELPLTIGGGIGQSRLCLFFLEKKHIGEVQASLWKNDDKLKKEGLEIL